MILQKMTMEIAIQQNRLGLQLPWVMPNYPSVTLYDPILRGNGVTQFRVMVKPLCESQAQSQDL